jgi:hypothetical protein
MEGYVLQVASTVCHSSNLSEHAAEQLPRNNQLKNNWAREHGVQTLWWCE